jgi:hypothetical protein
LAAAGYSGTKRDAHTGAAHPTAHLGATAASLVQLADRLRGQQLV